MKSLTRDLSIKWIALAAILFMFSCKKETTPATEGETKLETIGNGRGTNSPDMVLRWNDAATNVVLRTLQIQPTPRIPPFRESHYYATVNIAVHDALNNIVPKYNTYALYAPDKDADPDAAVAQAAHDVIAS